MDFLQPIDRDPINTGARGSALTRAKKWEDHLPDLLVVLAFFLYRFGNLALKACIHLAKVRARPPGAKVKRLGKGLTVSDLHRCSVKAIDLIVGGKGSERATSSVLIVVARPFEKEETPWP